MRLTQFRKVITMKNKRMKKNVSGYYVPRTYVEEISHEITKYNPADEFTMGAAFVLAFLSTDGVDGHIPQRVPFAEYAETISDLIPKKGQQIQLDNVAIPLPKLKEIVKAAEEFGDEETDVEIYRVSHDGDDK